MDLMAECLVKQTAFLVQDRPHEALDHQQYYHTHFGTSSEGDCNSDLIMAQQVSNASKWEGFQPGSSVAFLCSEHPTSVPKAGGTEQGSE